MKLHGQEISLEDLRRRIKPGDYIVVRSFSLNHNIYGDVLVKKKQGFVIFDEERDDKKFRISAKEGWKTLQTAIRYEYRDGNGAEISIYIRASHPKKQQKAPR